jgi:hypothetical protein
VNKRNKWLLAIGVIATLVVGWQVAAFAATLPGSLFEIDTDANLKVDTAGNLDWANVAEDRQADLTPGQGDNSFVQGTKEDTPVPVIEFGGIPPNKSDLRNFGVYTEDAFLELFWSRVQDPSGTTNMDFELNQKFCDTTVANDPDCTSNGVTPVRTGDGTGPGFDDLLITYDLSRGGTQATISIRKWTGTKWGPEDPLAPTEALGTINTSLIPDTESDGLGSLSPRTFGEAAISFDALFGPNACGSFGSAYLKSRSSDSFTAALKDFVPPEQVNISNCPAGITSEQSFIPNDAATITGTGRLTGTVTFNLYQTQDDCDHGTNSVYTEQKKLDADPGVTVSTTNDGNNANGGPTSVYTITSTNAGPYFWGVSYNGDADNDPTSTCVENSSVTINNT